MTRPDGPPPDDWRWGAWREGGPPRWGPGGRGGPRRRGFGCLFGLVFLVVAGSLVATTGYILSHAGGLAGLIALVVVVAILIALGFARIQFGQREGARYHDEHLGGGTILHKGLLDSLAHLLDGTTGAHIVWSLPSVCSSTSTGPEPRRSYDSTRRRPPPPRPP